MRRTVVGVRSLHGPPRINRGLGCLRHEWFSLIIVGSKILSIRTYSSWKFSMEMVFSGVAFSNRYCVMSSVSVQKLNRISSGIYAGRGYRIAGFELSFDYNFTKQKSWIWFLSTTVVLYHSIGLCWSKRVHVIRLIILFIEFIIFTVLIIWYRYLLYCTVLLYCSMMYQLQIMTIRMGTGNGII